MKFNVLYLFLIASISGVIGTEPEPGNSAIIINNKNRIDVPTASTLPASEPNSPTPDPDKTTTAPPAPPTPPPTIPTTTSASTTTTKTTEVPTTHSTTTVTSPTTTTSKPTNATTIPTKPTVSTTTESTTVVPTPAPSHKGRKFDGPSFIGGIILASGLMAICFVSWKFYKARTERNYHTL